MEKKRSLIRRKALYPPIGAPQLYRTRIVRIIVEAGEARSDRIA
ncbi:MULTISPECIES: hypothetical protein [Paraburkholderia]|uniref:Uncharacterized protein n=1 Tax=Paraburkholderia metrosideri TaxID=580937 RepID=A0ABW9E4G5_9BURK